VIVVQKRWAHVVCALWVPELYFGDSDLMEPIKGKPDAARLKLTCTICRKKGANYQDHITFSQRDLENKDDNDDGIVTY
jgi:hypothetical protein